MSGLCGWFSGSAREGAEPILRGMVAAAAAPGTPLVATQGGAALAAYETNVAPVFLEWNGCRLACVGHPRLRVPGLPQADPGALVRWLAEKGPREGLARVGGDFAIAFWDGRTNRGWIAIDRFGIQPLVYTRCGEALVYASALDSLGAFPGVRREIVPQAIFDYLFYHVSPGPQTLFRGQMRVPPGQFVEFGDHAVGTPVPYWSLKFDEVAGRPFETLKSEFRAHLMAAVREGAEGTDVGSFLSGGTDSSTVTGMLSRAGLGPARSFSIGFDVKGYDEMSYARIAARHFGAEHHEYYVTPDDVVKALPRMAASYDQPFGNASAIPTYYCSRFAREHGVKRMLAGDGGDELFGGNERYSKQYLLSLYQRVPASLRRGLLEPLLLASTPLHRVQPLRKIKSYIEQARPPMPQRYESYNLLQHLGTGTIFAPEFLSAIDLDHPDQLMVEAHAPFTGDSLVNQMLAIDIRFVLGDSDLPKVTRMCDLGGTDVTFPLLDDRLLEFSVGLAADLKLRGTTLRWFFKEALRDFLPIEVITKEKHGFGLPVGTWLVEHAPLRKLAVDAIATLRSRNIVQPAFIDDLLDHKLAEHPPYYGAMVWVLMMLGLWLDSRGL